MSSPAGEQLVKVKVRAQALQPGDVLTGSGFTVDGFVTSDPGCRSRVRVPGHYPFGATYTYRWNRNTTMTVERER